MPHGLGITHVLPSRVAQRRSGGTEPLVGGSTPPDTPKSLHEIALGTITRSAKPAPRRIGGQDLLHHAAARPRRIVNRDHDRLTALRRIRPSASAQLRRESRLAAVRCPVTGFLLLAGRWLPEPGRQCPAAHMAGGIAVSQVLLLPWAHDRSIPFDPKRRPQGWRAGQAGGIVTEPDTTASDGVFFTASSACRAACCVAGAPRRY